MARLSRRFFEQHGGQMGVVSPEMGAIPNYFRR